MKKTKNISSLVANLTKQTIEDCGCFLWDVEFIKEGSEYNLIISIDKPGGVSLSDCEMINNAVSPIIEDADPIDGSYFLEISSPGIERELKTKEHIEAFLGSDIMIKLYAPKGGKKTLSGKLESFDNEENIITLKDTQGNLIHLSRKECAKIQTVFDF